MSPELTHIILYITNDVLKMVTNSSKALFYVIHTFHFLIFNIKTTNALNKIK